MPSLQSISLVLLASLALAGGAPAQQKPAVKNDPSLAAPVPVMPVPSGNAAPAAGPMVTFGGVPYFYRWRNANMRELTPRGQEDLQRWSDMVTVVYYPQVRDEAALLATAKAIAQAYQRNQGTLLKTETAPAAAGRPAEHFVSVTFNRPGTSELTCARVVLRDGMGVAVLYGHRAYGPRAALDLADWLRANLPRVNQSLRAVEAIPPIGGWPQ